eukprot:1161829-Pelagomonas_calceolata.AAC.21
MLLLLLYASGVPSLPGRQLPGCLAVSSSSNGYLGGLLRSGAEQPSCISAHRVWQTEVADAVAHSQCAGAAEQGVLVCQHWRAQRMLRVMRCAHAWR